MKSRIALSVLFVLFAIAAYAQSDAQKSFATMKSLAGEWEGPVNVPEMPEISGRQAAARLAARDLEGQRAGARDAGSRNAFGSDKI